MALKTLTLALVLTGLAAGLYASRRRETPLARARRGDLRDMGRSGTTPGMAGMPTTSRTANSGWAAGSEGSDLFSSSSQKSEEPAGTGLPDLTRGA